MSPAHSCFFKILWITLQMVFALIDPHSESATAHFHPYLSEFRYVPQYHPSRNPDCTSQWLRREVYDRQFEHGNRRRSSFEEPLVDQDHPWIEIRAVVVRCSKTRKEIKKMSHMKPIQNCRRKVIISMRINNAGKTNTREEFVLVDHILDPVKMHKIRLLNPYVIKVRQEPLLHLYGLRFQGVVNAEAREEVINNRRANFTGCNDDLNNPTCGQMLINGEPIPFSQGFCCSCEDAQRAGSFRSVAAKSNYYRRDDSANRTRNRSESSGNLFDNSKAERQVKTNGNVEHNRQVGLENDDARGRVTSRNISAVNGPFGEQVPPLRKHQAEKQLRNNSARQPIRPSEGFPWMENVDRATTLSPILKSVFFDPSPSKGKIEAYIDAVYEQAMKERAVKQEDDKRSKDLMDESGLLAGNLSDPQNRFQDSSREMAIDQRTGDGRSPIYGSATDNPRDAKLKGDCDSNKLKSREPNSIHGSGANNPRNPTTKLMKLQGKQDFTKTGGKGDNRKFVQLEKCDRSVNFSESGNREESTRDRCRGVTRLENTFGYTPTFLAIHSSRIPEESQFSRRMEKNAFSNDNALTDNRNFATTVELTASVGIPFKNNINAAINYGNTSSMIKPNNFEKGVFAQLSKIVISETRSSTVSEERRYGFRAPENIADNVNAPRNASVERKNLSAAAIRDGDASDGGRKAGNANVSTQISTASAFTRLRNPSSPVGISRLGEFPATAVPVRPGDKSSTKILESKTRGSLLANGMRGFSGDFGNLYEGRGSRGIYNSPEQTSKDVNLKNSYKFWKPRRKLRKSKGAGKFGGNKGIRRKLGHFGKSSRHELIWKRALPDFGKFRNEPSKDEGRSQRRLRRHLPAGKRNLNTADVRNENLENEEDSHRKEAFNYHTRSATTQSNRMMSETRGNEGPKKQVILESGQSYRKIQPGESDNTFSFDNESDKESNVDKRIEDRFVRISNVLKEDSTEARIIQETSKNFKAVTKSEVAKADILKIQDELRNNLLSRTSDKSNDPIVIRSDEVTHEYSVELHQGTHQRSTTDGNFIATFLESTMTDNEVATISSSTRKHGFIDYKESIFPESKEKLSATVIGPFPPSSIMRKPGYNVSEEMIDPSSNPFYTNEFTMKQTELFTRQKLSSETPRGRGVNGHFEAANGPLRTSSSSWANSKETSPGASNNRSEGERDEAGNTRSLELNNNSSRMITGNSAGPQGPPIESGLSLRGSASVTEPEEASSSNEEREGSRYAGDPPLDGIPVGIPGNEGSSARSQGSRQRDEIAELVDRIVRQYAAYTPIMPGMPTFDEITEAETLPPEDLETVTEFTTMTTTLATTTRITDAIFRPSIRPRETTSPPEEMRDEISLDETTFVDETEATTISQRTTVSKRKFPTRRPGATTALQGKARKIPSKSSGKRRQKTGNRITSKKFADTEEEAVDHPWYRPTEAQQIIVANRSELVQKAKGERKKQCYKSKVDYSRNVSSAWTSSTTVSSSVADGAVLAQTRRRRSDFIRESSDRDSSIFYEYEEGNEEDRRSGKTASNKIGESPDMTEPTELRSRIEKRLSDELDYPANRKSFRHSCESRDQTQKHNAASQDIASRNVVLRINNDLEKRALNGDVQEKERIMKGSLKNRTFSKLYRAKDDEIGKFDEEVSSKNHRAVTVSLGTWSTAKIPPSRKNLSGLVRERLEIDRRTEEEGERAVAEIDGIAAVREIAVILPANARTASASDLSNCVAEPRVESATGRTLQARARNSGDRDKSKTDTVVRGVKLMIADDKSETRDLDVAAKSADKNIPPSFPVAKQPERENARKINENPAADHRVRHVSAGKEYFRRPRGKMYDTDVRKMFGKIKKGRSSSVSDEVGIEKGIARSVERADRLSDWRRSGRRLLSNRKSGYTEDADDEHYEDDESETDEKNDSASDNEAIAERDDLSDLENQPGLREDRDPRKLVAETVRLAGENTDTARTMMPEERTVAPWDAAMISDDTRAISEEAISRNNGKEVTNKNTDSEGRPYDIDSIDPVSFSNVKILKAPLKIEKKSIIQSTADNNTSVQKKNSDESALKSFRIHEKVDEEPLSFREKIKMIYEDDLPDKSFYEAQPIFDTSTEEIINFPTTTNQNLLSAGRIFHNVDFSQDSGAPRNEGSIKISLTGRIELKGDFNQTPMLMNFDTIPDRSSATQSSVSTELLNAMFVSIETTAINLPSDNSNAEYTFDLSSITERANDEADDPLNVILNEAREVGKTDANEVGMKSREKFFDLAQRSGEERKMEKKNSSRIEKRLDKYNAKSRTAKQVFLTDYSKPSIASSGKMDRTNVEGMISERSPDEAIDKSDSRSSAVYFPDILGSVLINNGSLKDRDATKESRCRVDVPSIEANRSDSNIDRSNTTTLHIVPLLHVRIEKPSVDSANDTASNTRNATSGGCYRMPTIARKLELPGTTSRESQTSSNYRDSDPTVTFQPGTHEVITDDRNVATVRSSSPTRLQDVSEATIESATNETFLAETPCGKRNDESINAIHVRNMMAIVRFLMKLLRIITEDEEFSCPRTQIGDTMIQAKNVVVNVSSRGGNRVGKQKSAADRTTITSEGTRQDLTTAEWRSTITERIREKSSPLGDGTFESFTEAPSHPAASTLQTSFDEAFKNEGLSTGREAHAPTLSSATSTTTPKSFLFYEPERKSLRREVASRKSISVGLMGVKQNSNVPFDDSKEDSRGRKSRLDDDQTNRSYSWPRRNQDQSSADRSHFSKQEIASTRNSKKNKTGSVSFQKEYLARNKSGGFRLDVANDTIRPMLARDTNVSRDALLERTAREDISECSKKSNKIRKAGVLDRRVTRTKLLNSSGRGGSSRDWIGKHRAATRRLPIDNKLRESRDVPGGTVTREKVVFRHVSGKINRPRDPNLVGGQNDSFKIEGHVDGSDPLARLSTDYVLSDINGRLSSLKGASSSEKTNVMRYSSTSSSTSDVGVSRIDEEIVNEHARFRNFTSPRSVPNKKRDVGENSDSQKGNRVLRKRQKAPIPKRKTKWRRKKKRKKSSKRTKDILETGNQRRFKRHLLMAPLEPEYDADDAAARLSRRYIAERRNAEYFRRSAGENAARREDGSRMVDGSEADPGRAQIRGGQDCTDRRHPPNIDAAKYLESAHCLRFSDLWYSVYQLEDPIVEHTVYLQVYEKRALANGSTYWEDLTGDSVVRLGTFNRHHRGSEDTIAFTYKEVKISRREEEQLPNLDVVRDRLLVPSSVTSKDSGHPVEGESDEYLVVPANSINQNGNECDKAGVGFAAFAGQPDRCERVRGTCLKNQPLAYRRHDVEARAAGRPGCYFLSNFASVPSEPIKYSANGSGSREFLALEYHSPHVSAIDIEVRAGYNAALAGGSLGCISEVHVDCTAIDHTVMTIVMTNTGRTSTFYRSRIADCPDGLPESWVNATFPKKLVQPRQDKAVSLDLYGELPINEFYCSVRLMNRFGVSVATRRIKIRKMDRCSCTRHCLCVCVGDTRGTECRPMSPELFHAAGFHGPVPGASREIFSETTINVLLFIVSLILLLLFMGFLKWLIGLYIPAVSRWGLDSLLGTNRMSEYLERELKYRCVMTDEHGAPVHPDTRKRTVRICSRKAEFFLNMIFFLTFPFAICCYRLKKFFQPVRRRYCSDESKISLTSDKSEHPRTICVNTYGDNRDSQMEAEDTKYVMDELKKSEELLRCRSKRSRCTKGYRSRD